MTSYKKDLERTEVGCSTVQQLGKWTTEVKAIETDQIKVFFRE